MARSPQARIRCKSKRFPIKNLLEIRTPQNFLQKIQVQIWHSLENCIQCRFRRILLICLIIARLRLVHSICKQKCMTFAIVNSSQSTGFGNIFSLSIIFVAIYAVYPFHCSILASLDERFSHRCTAGHIPCQSEVCAEVFLWCDAMWAI